MFDVVLNGRTWHGAQRIIGASTKAKSILYPNRKRMPKPFLRIRPSPGHTRYNNRVIKLACITLIAYWLVPGGLARGQSTDLASNQLLAIAEKEAAIYRKIAEDPDFYSETDLDRQINELAQSYRHYLADQPDDVSAYVLYGKLLRRLEQYDQAFVAFLKADELDPRIAVVKQQIGNHLAEQGKGKAAFIV